jgi:hypothetical protein
MAYMKQFESEDEATELCRLKNTACRNAGNHRDIFAVVDGPEDDFAVVDLLTAINLGLGYRVAG